MIENKCSICGNSVQSYLRYTEGGKAFCMDYLSCGTSNPMHPVAVNENDGYMPKMLTKAEYIKYAKATGEIDEAKLAVEKLLNSPVGLRIMTEEMAQFLYIMGGNKVQQYLRGLIEREMAENPDFVKPTLNDDEEAWEDIPVVKSEPEDPIGEPAPEPEVQPVPEAPEEDAFFDDSDDDEGLML